MSKQTTIKIDLNVCDLEVAVHAELSINVTPTSQRLEHFGTPVTLTEEEVSIELDSFAATIGEDEVTARPLLRSIREQIHEYIERNEFIICLQAGL